MVSRTLISTLVVGGGLPARVIRERLEIIMSVFLHLSLYQSVHGALLLLLGFQAMPHTKCVAGVHGRMYVSEQRSRRGVLDTGRVVLWCKGNAKYEELVQFLSI